jgi:aspartyl/asparaginyl beta-hydroxylase (cupin superfamily)
MNNTHYPFTKVLEDHWQEIYNEYLQVNQLVEDWHEKHLYDGNWEVFGLFDFPKGNEIAENTKLCPVTTKLIKDNIVNHGSVAFSKLTANTIIKPHKGYQGDYLRLQLGLEIPVGDCGLKTYSTVHRWEQGKTFIFDDRQLHEAWNKTDNDRVILIIDFVP